MKQFLSVIIVGLSLLLAACSGGGGDGNPLTSLASNDGSDNDSGSGSGGDGGGDGGSGSSGDPFILNATVRYERLHPTASSGLDLNNPTMEPVPGAVVEVWGDGSRLVSGNLDANGQVTVSVPSSTDDMRFVVLSQLGSPGSPNTTVGTPVGGQGSSAIQGPYRQEVTFTPTGDTHNLGMDIDSGLISPSSGLDDTARDAGPFAVIDAVYRSQEMIRTADPDVVFPPVTIRWSTDLFWGSFYNPSTETIDLNGDQFDNDEYDFAIVIHEWGHYMEDNFSRSDSLGGPHGTGDRLDDTVAFGEGWATAWAGMVLNDQFGEALPTYIDTSLTDVFGNPNPQTGLAIGIETDSVTDPGYWSEDAILQLIYDMYDDNNEGAGDQLSLGFTPFYETFTGPQADTPAFTSIYSFLHEYKQAVPGDADVVDQMSLAQNITPTDNPFGPVDGDGMPPENRHYIILPTDESVVDTDPDGQSLATDSFWWDSASFSPANGKWPGNKLFQRWMFRMEVPADGVYTAVATPRGQVNGAGQGQLFLFLPDSSAFISDQSDTDGETVEFDETFSAGDHLVFSIGSWEDETNFDVQVTSVPATNN